MIRLLNFFSFFMMVGCAIWAYSVKYETISVSESLRKKQSELVHEQEAIAILKAEWQVLNRPSRLQRLASFDHDMQVISSKQMVSISEIPYANSTSNDPLEALVTGSFATPNSSRKDEKQTETPGIKNIFKEATITPSKNTASMPLNIIKNNSPAKDKDYSGKTTTSSQTIKLKINPLIISPNINNNPPPANSTNIGTAIKKEKNTAANAAENSLSRLLKKLDEQM